MMVQLSSSNKKHHKKAHKKYQPAKPHTHAPKGHGHAKFSIPHGIKDFANSLASRDYGFHPHKMATKKAIRKQKLHHKVHNLSHAYKKEDEEEFQKGIHGDVENGIEQQSFVKNGMRRDNEDEIGTREMSRMVRRGNKLPKKVRSYESGSDDSDDEELPVRRSSKILHREIPSDEEEIPLRRYKRVHRKNPSDDEEIPVRRSRKFPIDSGSDDEEIPIRRLNRRRIHRRDPDDDV